MKANLLAGVKTYEEGPRFSKDKAGGSPSPSNRRKTMAPGSPKAADFVGRAGSTGKR